MTDTPIARLRALHRHCSPCAFKNHWFVEREEHCHKCLDPYPCLTIAALDALEAELDGAGEVRHADALQSRLAAATVLIRQVVGGLGHTHGDLSCLLCDLARAWLAGDKEAE